MQQDLPIIKSFNIEKVMKIMNNKDNMDCVRYSCYMSNKKHEKFALDHCKKILDPVSINIEDMNFIQCSSWSDNNYIAKISHYNDFVWKNVKPYSFMEHDLFCYPVNNNYRKIWYLGDKDDYFCEHTDGRNTN
jgi:hypothetical protein